MVAISFRADTEDSEIISNSSLMSQTSDLFNLTILRAWCSHKGDTYFNKPAVVYPLVDSSREKVKKILLMPIWIISSLPYNKPRILLLKC